MLMIIKKEIFALSLVAALALISSDVEARAAIKQFNNKQESIFEFLADDMEYSKTEVIGKGHVTIINLDYFVTANKAVYDTQNQEIILSGNVNAYKGNSLYLKSEEVKINFGEFLKITSVSFMSFQWYGEANHLTNICWLSTGC